MSKLLLIISIILGIYIFAYILVKFSETRLTFAAMGGNEKIKIGKGRKKIERKFGFSKRKIVGLYKNNKASKAMMFFHGNGETLNNKFFLKYLADNFTDYNILAFDYPAYGESQGFPWKKNAYKASELFYNWLIEVKKIKAENIVLRGYSVGTALATDLASKNTFDSLILISPFSSRYAMSEYKLGFVPAKFLLIPNSLKTISKIKQIKNKTLVVHGNEDTTVPYFMGKQIFKNSGSSKKQFITIPKGTHRILRDDAEKLLTYYKNFLTKKSFGISDEIVILDVN